MFIVFFLFFQAEDGIRYWSVTGVQTWLFRSPSVEVCTLGNSVGKTVVMKTGSLVTTAVTANQVVLTYTVTVAKAFYLEYLNMDAYITSQPGNGNPILLGTVSLETPSGTKVIADTMFHPNSMGFNTTFSEPIPVLAGVVIRVVTTPSVTTGVTWGANFGGYEI